MAQEARQRRAARKQDRGRRVTAAVAFRKNARAARGTRGTRTTRRVVAAPRIARKANDATGRGALGRRPREREIAREPGTGDRAGTGKTTPSADGRESGRSRENRERMIAREPGRRRLPHTGDKKCSWIGSNKNRCVVKGDDERWGFEACRETCGTCLEKEACPKDGDAKSDWMHASGDDFKNCPRPRVCRFSWGRGDDAGCRRGDDARRRPRRHPTASPRRVLGQSEWPRRRRDASLDDPRAHGVAVLGRSACPRCRRDASSDDPSGTPRRRDRSHRWHRGIVRTGGTAAGSSGRRGDRPPTTGAAAAAGDRPHRWRRWIVAAPGDEATSHTESPNPRRRLGRRVLGQPLRAARHGRQLRVPGLPRGVPCFAAWMVRRGVAAPPWVSRGQSADGSRRRRGCSRASSAETGRVGHAVALAGRHRPSLKDRAMPLGASTRAARPANASRWTAKQSSVSPEPPRSSVARSAHRCFAGFRRPDASGNKIVSARSTSAFVKIATPSTPSKASASSMPTSPISASRVRFTRIFSVANTQTMPSAAPISAPTSTVPDRSQPTSTSESRHTSGSSALRDEMTALRL